MARRLAKKVLLIGWDAADWKAITPLLDAGKMPVLERFINEGVMGNLRTLQPVLSPMLWTSIATGKRAFNHGIHGFTEPDPHTGAVRPVTNISRKVKAVWNIFNQNGLKSNVVGWWPSHPAEPIDGVMVSNHYQRAPDDLSKPWPMQPGTVHPAELAKDLAPFRLHPLELDGNQLLPFIPKAAEIDQAKDKRVHSLARIVADTASIHAAATGLMQLQPWDFMAVYYDAIDHFGHGFMKYHPPRQPQIPERDFELYKDVIEAGYRFHDMLLDALLQLAGDDTTVILMSDHGFHPDHLRPGRIPAEPAGPAVEHRPYGVFVMKGPGIKKDERVYGATLLDIAPTLLTLFGLPVGRDMRGKALIEAFEEPPTIESIPTWEEVEGDSGQHGEEEHLTPEQAQESLKQLIELGYIEDPGPDKDLAVYRTVREARYNLAQAFMDANYYAEAAVILEELWKLEPEEVRFANQLNACYQSLGRLDEARELVEEIIDTQERLAHQARSRIQELQQRKAEEAAKKKMDAAAEKPTAKPQPDAAADKETDVLDLNPQEMHQLRQWRQQATPSPHAADYLRGFLANAEGRYQDALGHLRKIEKARTRQPNLHLQIGQVYLQLKRHSDAQRAYQRALEADPDNAQGHLGLAQSLLAQRQIVDAANEALAAVGLQYHFPQAHFTLGVALHRVGYLPRAVEALQVALAQNPGYVEAHKRLVYLYEKRLDQPEKAAEHRERIQEIRQRRRNRRGQRQTQPERRLHPALDSLPLLVKPALTEKPAESPKPRPSPVKADPQAGPVTIVSGLPRSGTSMMMQMLVAGGIAALTDGQRQANEDNPRGYLEFEKAKQLRRDAAWLPQGQGKVVKIIAQQLPFLPMPFPYRVVFMERDIDEILASQKTMLERDGHEGARLSAGQLAQTFKVQLQQVKTMLAQRRIPTLYVPHRDAIADAGAIAARVDEFLGGDLDREAMIRAVDPELYRQRHAGASPT